MSSLLSDIESTSHGRLRPVSAPVVTDRRGNALKRVEKKLGKALIAAYQSEWARLSQAVQPHSREAAAADTFLITLLMQKLSHYEIQAILPVGAGRLVTLGKVKTGELPLCRERPTCIPSHAFTQEQIQAIKDDYINWELEDGYPCAHRRIKQYFITPGTTWTRVHEQYYDRVAATGIVPASYDRWRQYIRAIYPSLRLCKAKKMSVMLAYD
jgi:hypothetical protein